MAALRWAALNLWSSHDTARDDPPAATTDDESQSHETHHTARDDPTKTTTDDEASASESDESVTRSLPPLEAPMIEQTQSRERASMASRLKFDFRTGTYASPRAATTPTRSTTSRRPSRAGPERTSTRRRPPSSSSAPRKGATRAPRRTSGTSPSSHDYYYTNLLPPLGHARRHSQ